MSADRKRAYLGQMPAEADDTPQPDTLHPCRVLIVDDDDLVRARLAALLRASNYEIEEAASGEEALRVMSAKHCHIVVTDWEMPDMDGLALCRCVRVSQEDGYVYLLMLTVHDSKDDMLAGLAAGADDYVVKGASVNEILARLEVGRRIVYLERSLRANRGNRHLALTDSLTGTHNLRYFVKQLARELARSQRYNHPLSVLSCDVDGFMSIRERYGHEAAAELLRAFVSRTESCIRASSDWIARVGVGEFMIVLPETPAFGAYRVAEKLQATFAMEPVGTRAGPVPLKATTAVVSMDAGKRPDSAARIEELIRTARRGFHARRQLSDAQARAASLDGAGGLAAQSRRGHGLN